MSGICESTLGGEKNSGHLATLLVLQCQEEKYSHSIRNGVKRESELNPPISLFSLYMYKVKQLLYT